MPDWAERKIKERGGVARWRTIKRDGKTLRCAVTKKAGPQGGKTVCYPVESVEAAAREVVNRLLGEDTSKTDVPLCAWCQQPLDPGEQKTHAGHCTAVVNREPCFCSFCLSREDAAADVLHAREAEASLRDEEDADED